MKTKYIRITKFTLAMLILLVVQFSNVIAQQPLSAKDWLAIGNEEAGEKQYSQAITSFSECLKLDKTAFTCFINRGVAYRNLKQNAEAISDYSEAIRLNPKATDAYINRGVLNSELKNYSQAKSDFSKALELEPNNKAATDNLAKLKGITAKDDYDISNFEFKPVGGCVSGNCVNGKGKFKELFNENTYEGDFVESDYHGKGKIKYTNGDTYEGDFVKSIIQGQGTYTFKDGSYYVGEWKNDKQNGYGKYYAKATNTTQEGTWKDGVLVSAAKNTVTPNASNPDTAVNSKTATLLRDTLNGKFDLMEGKPLVYELTNKKTGETLVYRIEFINDGGKLAFKWKETTKNEQSEKLVITDRALVSATKYINFFNAKTSISPDNEIAFILSQTLYGKLKSNKEISIDFGTGPKTMVFFKKFFEPMRQNYQNKSLALLHLQSGDGMTQIKIMDDPICPLIVEINTLLYKFKLQG